MIVYLDTSAFVPLILSEPTSPACRRLWNDADVILGTDLLYVESSAALSRAAREGRIRRERIGEVVDRLDALWRQLRVIEIDAVLTEAAAKVAWRFGLRGYDAVHCAAGALVGRGEGEPSEEVPQTVAASGDEALLEAWRQLGVPTFDPSPVKT